jgi:hypothetical protein
VLEEYNRLSLNKRGKYVRIPHKFTVEKQEGRLS